MIPKFLKFIINSKICYCAVLISILFIHISLRNNLQKNLTLENHHFYPQEHIISLSLLAGKWLSAPKLTDQDENDPGIIEIKKFLNLKKVSLSQEQLSKFKSIQKFEKINEYHKNRIFDYLTAALVWKVMGVNWNALIYFYILVSACANLCYIMALKNITNNKLVSVVVGILIACSPNEIALSVWSYRDCNPAWFFAFSFLCISHFYKNKQIKFLFFYFVLGILTFIGYGWRSDNLLIILSSFFLILLLLKTQQASIGLKIQKFVAYCCGSAFVYLFLIFNTDKSKYQLSDLYFFHIADYSENDRANILNNSNKFELFFLDENVSQNVFAISNIMPNYLDQNYSNACLKIFISILNLNKESYLKKLPFFIFQTYPKFETTTYLGDISVKLNQLAKKVLLLDSFIRKPIANFFIIVIVFSCLNILSLEKNARSILLFIFVFYLFYSVVFFFILPHLKHYALGTQGFAFFVSSLFLIKEKTWFKNLQQLKYLLFCFLPAVVFFFFAIPFTDDTKSILNYIEKNTLDSKEEFKKTTVSLLEFYPSDCNNDGTKELKQVKFKTLNKTNETLLITFNVERPAYRVKKIYSINKPENYNFVFCLSPSLIKKDLTTFTKYQIKFNQEVAVESIKNSVVKKGMTDISILFENWSEDFKSSKTKIYDHKVLIEPIY